MKLIQTTFIQTNQIKETNELGYSYKLNYKKTSYGLIYALII